MTKLAHLTVSRQGFGAMGLSSTYGPAEDAESIRTLHRAIDLGITFFDTATSYGGGHNERLLGQAIADRRQGLVIASKFVHRPAGAGPDAPRINAREAVEASLERLGLDHIDLYYLHRVDPHVPIEESVGELGRLREEGKIGAVGVSEASADQLRHKPKRTEIIQREVGSCDLSVDFHAYVLNHRGNRPRRSLFVAVSIAEGLSCRWTDAPLRLF